MTLNANLCFNEDDLHLLMENIIKSFLKFTKNFFGIPYRVNRGTRAI